MRDLVLLMGMAAMLPMIIVQPYLGVLVWCWTALLVPNTYAFGFASDFRFNFWVAILTVVVWLFSNEPKRIPINATTLLLLLLLGWGTLSSALTLSPSPAVTWIEWDKFIKIIALALVITALIRTEVRIRALLFAIAMSMGYHAVAESIKFLLSRGAHKIWGPGSSIIGDNNQFALATIMVIPVLVYLFIHTRNRLVRLGLAGGVFLQVVAVIGTGSRGGLIGIAALGAWILATTRRKLRYLFVAALIGAVALSLAPERWYERMRTIDTANADQSFMGRVIAWKINTLAAMEHPFMGAGFRSTQDITIWLHYADQFSRLDFIPTPEPARTFARAAHSIYFQVLGDMGFAGLGIFLAILIVAWRNASIVMSRTAGLPEYKWANDLARTLQYCLVPYLVSGAALNMAYFDLSYAIVALLAVLRMQTDSLAAAKDAASPRAGMLVREA